MSREEKAIEFLTMVDVDVRGLGVLLVTFDVLIIFSAMAPSITHNAFFFTLARISPQDIQPIHFFSYFSYVLGLGALVISHSCKRHPSLDLTGTTVRVIAGCYSSE